MRLHRVVIRFIAVLAPALSCCAHADNTCPPALLERDLNVDTPAAGNLRTVSLPDAMHALRIPSVSMALISDNRIAWTRAYGDATPATLYQAGSLTKTVTAAAALRLVQDGQLKLDTPVNDTLTSWSLPDSEFTQQHPVTLRGLLNMTAGVNVAAYPGYARGTARANSVAILDGTLPATSTPVRVQRAPGSAYAKSSGGFQIVQTMIEDATHESFPDAVSDLVLQPAGMSDSVYELTPALENGQRIARGHEADGQELSGGWRETPELAASGLWSTPTDFARLLISLSNAYAGRRPAILAESAARDMLTKSAAGPYGLGVAVAGSGSDLVFMKRGQNPGYQSMMLMFPRTGDGIVLMTGSNNGNTLETSLIRRAATVCGWPDLGQLMD
jgi:CubicO group peptidase (beta-lactamase class C family)